MDVITYPCHNPDSILPMEHEYLFKFYILLGTEMQDTADIRLYGWQWQTSLKTLRLRQNGRQFPDDIFKCIFLNENVWISTKISLKFVPKGPINNIPTLVQIMAWRQQGDKPLSEPMMVRLSKHKCVPQPQWVKESISSLLMSWRCKEPGHQLPWPSSHSIFQIQHQ